MKTSDDIFERHERVQCSGYYDDPRWEQVKQMRKDGKDLAANGLAFEIRDDWGL